MQQSRDSAANYSSFYKKKRYHKTIESERPDAFKETFELSDSSSSLECSDEETHFSGFDDSLLSINL